jgi:uncharacterized protein (DUF58 family)
MRPSFRAVAVFAAGVPLTAAVVLIDEGLWPFGAIYPLMALLLLGVDAALTLPASRLAIRVIAPGVLHLDDHQELLIEAETPAWRGRTRLRLLCDVDGPLSRPTERTLVVQAGRTARLALPLVAERRGTAVVQRLWVRWHGPLALIWRIRSQPIAQEVRVVPNIRAVRQAAIQFASRDAFHGVKVASQLGEGTEFDALRDWVLGLNTRDIDWKRSARHLRLVCKEFRAERNHNIVLAFDTGHLMGEPLGGIPRLDRAINAGLLLVYLSLQSGDRVGLFALDDRVRLYLEPTPGVHAFARVQHALAGIAYGTAETNFTLGLAHLNARLRRRSLVVLFTEFVDTVTASLMVDTLAHVARRHVVLFVTLQDPLLRATLDAAPRAVDDIARAVVADSFIRDRSIVLNRLTRLGVQCLDAPADRLGADVINRYLKIKRLEMI